MTRRGRVIFAALGLVVLFVWISSRNSRSDSRELRKPRVKEPKAGEQIHSPWKEPPGQWDPVEDRFAGQQQSDEKSIKHIQEQKEEIVKHGGDLPDEGIKRKTPKRPLPNPKNVENTNKGNGQPEPKKQFSEQGSNSGGSAGPVYENAAVIPPEYNPSEGSSITSIHLTGRFESDS